VKSSTRARWWIAVGSVFGVQLGVIFWLGDAKPKPQSPFPNVPQLRLAGPGSAELLALTDPTLFALPHRLGFSGAASQLPEIRPEPRLEWRDTTPQWLVPLAADELGSAFRAYMATNIAELAHVMAQPSPQLVLPEPSTTEDFLQASTFRLTGELAHRRLLTSFELPSWTNEVRPGELLTNSVVELAVAADGRPVSVALLSPNSGSGSTNADQRALELARAARFEPLHREALQRGLNPLTDVVWGELVFEWHTLSSNNKPAVENKP
jgi:hypothetical protein